MLKEDDNLIELPIRKGYNMGVIAKIRKYEKRFQKNRYNGSGKEAHKIRKGRIPIIVSAPHAVNHYRETEVKFADQFTGGIAYFLYKRCGCHLIYSASYNEVDPNFDDIQECTYKKELEKYIKDNDIKFLIDLHGSKAEREFAVEMGTIDDRDSSLQGYSFLMQLIEMIFEDELSEYLKFDDKVIQKNKVFAASNPNTVTHYISQEVGIPAIQIEINRLYRDINNEERLCKLITALERIVNITGTIDWNAAETSVLRVRKSGKHFPQDKIELNTMAFGEISELDIIYAKSEHNNQTICKIQKSDEFEFGYAYLTNRLLDQLFQGRDYEKELLLIYRYDDMSFPIGRPMAGVNKICFSPDIYEKMDKDKKYILHPSVKNGCKMYVIPNKYPRGDKKVYIPRYYRLLMGISDKEIEMSQVQVLPGIKSDKGCNSNWCSILRDYLLDLFIGYREIDMIVERPNDADDQNLIGRLSGDMMKVIGVSDNDIICITFGEKEEIVKVLEGESHQAEKDAQTNSDMYVGIPAEMRSELGVMPGDIIKVKRNMEHIFIRNFNQQLFAIFGTVLTLITLTDNLILRIIGAVIAIPFVIWITFAEERVKIERKRK